MKYTGQQKITAVFRSLSKKEKIQLLIAAVLTLAVAAAIPALAWFSSQKEMTLSTRVNSPSNLYINAAHREAIENFKLSDINVEDLSASTHQINGVEYSYQDFVFCVCGDKVSRYDLQLSHTSNIPFVYTLYKATEDDNGEVVAKIGSSTYKYALGEKVVFDYENLNTLDNRTANSDQTLRNYLVTDNVQRFADPVYHLKRNISTDSPDGGFANYYVLRLSWIQQKDLTAQQRIQSSVCRKRIS